MRSADETVVVLGDERRNVERFIESGRFSNESEVIRAGILALEREENRLDAILREKLREAADDPRPNVPVDEVFERLRRRQAERLAERGV